jgi:transposase
MNVAQILDPELLQKENIELRCEITHLQEQLDWFKRQVFGKRSERIVSEMDVQQLEFAGFLAKKAEESQTEETTTTRVRKKPNRNGQDAITLPPDLPVKTTILDIPEEEKVCPTTGIPLVQIGFETTHKLAHEPGSYYVKEILRPKYAHPEMPEHGVKTAELPDGIIPKCRADESLLAEIITQKFADHLPLYRIAERMERDGIGISHKLLSQWVIRCGMALKPLYNVMVAKILESQNVFIDESPVKLQAKGQCDTAYMWVLVGGNESNPPYRAYDFRPDRRHDHVLEMLQGYRGVLHSDKYGVRHEVAQILVVAKQQLQILLCNSTERCA